MSHFNIRFSVVLGLDETRQAVVFYVGLAMK